MNSVTRCIEQLVVETLRQVRCNSSYRVFNSDSKFLTRVRNLLSKLQTRYEVLHSIDCGKFVQLDGMRSQKAVVAESGFVPEVCLNTGYLISKVSLMETP